MIDINLIRTNAELVKENIKKKFQDKKLPLVDEALSLDTKRRALIAEGDTLRSARNTLSKQVGMLMKGEDYKSVIAHMEDKEDTHSANPFAFATTPSPEHVVEEKDEKEEKTETPETSETGEDKE